MSVHTRTHPTRSKRGKKGVIKATRRKRIPWRDVAKKEINKFSEPGVMLKELSNNKLNHYAASKLPKIDDREWVSIE